MQDIFDLLTQAMSEMRVHNTTATYARDGPDTIFSCNLYLPENRICSISCMASSVK